MDYNRMNSKESQVYEQWHTMHKYIQASIGHKEPNERCALAVTFWPVLPDDQRKYGHSTAAGADSHINAARLVTYIYGRRRRVDAYVTPINASVHRLERWCRSEPHAAEVYNHRVDASSWINESAKYEGYIGPLVALRVEGELRGFVWI